MKFCPTCQTRYDEEILRFCTKDGTPLLEETPNFTALPSESEADDFGEETIIRRKPVLMPTEPLPQIEETENKRDSAPRIVIPTNEPLPPPQETVRTKTTPSVRRDSPPPKSNTGKIVLATIIGTMALLASAAGVYWLLGNQNAGDANKNVNANFNAVDTNLNTNLSVDNSIANFNTETNADANANANVKTNANTNVNAKSPTPKPSASPSPTATANNSNANNSNSATPSPTPAQTPTATPPPTSTPRPTPTAPPDNRPVNAGVLNGRATSLPKPAYPSAAKQARASGQVNVQVLVDESGNVLSARATSGHPLLRAASEAAARQSRFNPVKVGDRNVQATGIVVYNFIYQ